MFDLINIRFGALHEDSTKAVEGVPYKRVASPTWKPTKHTPTSRKIERAFDVAGIDEVDADALWTNSSDAVKLSIQRFFDVWTERVLLEYDKGNLHGKTEREIGYYFAQLRDTVTGAGNEQG